MTSSFTILNQADHTLYFHVYKLGCGGLPWIDGKPRCHTLEVAPGQHQTYTPSNWVDHFALIASIIGDVVLMAAGVAVTIATAGGAAPVEGAAAAELAETIAEAAAEAGTEVSTEVIEDAIVAAGQNARIFAGLTGKQLASIGVTLGMKAIASVTQKVLTEKYSGYAWYLTQSDGRILRPIEACVDVGGDANTSAFIYGPDTTDAWQALSADEMPGKSKLSRLPGF